MAISPKPNILNSIPLVVKRPDLIQVNMFLGNNILIGASKFLATVTITGVKKTQKISQKKRADNNKIPVLNESNFKSGMVVIEKARPRMLDKIQFLVKE